MLRKSADKLSGIFLLLLLSSVLSGCTIFSNQEFTAFSPDQVATLLTGSKRVVEVSTKPLVQRADYTLREKMSMLAPMPTKWQVDLEWTVTRVLKGDRVDDKMLVKNLPFPSAEARKLGFAEWHWATNPFTNGLVLWVGFDHYDGSHFQNLRLLKPTEDQMHLPAAAFENHSQALFRNYSVAAVDSLRLEVEQPLYETSLHIRITDGSWNENPSCEVYYVDEAGRESKLATVKLWHLAPTSNEYWGSFSHDQELSHGTTVKVVYKSNALRLPLSTWITMVYH